ncbi:hypothetical protein OHW02_16690 [Acinetobacter baumannii]|uniref:hypothetical protein n=1 Tax=Acinetobacter baumannii TaxID=470 RepID=UPI002340A448|nr:hypothetical protein [Acinetobacter baumannii]MDC4966471.1 hypothetical protein [Acinetobacter baumannii]MDH2654282.1 hypothetical protein [Acinetobacter baumannii]
MMNEPNLAIFHQAFSSRAKIVELLPEVLKPSSNVLEILKESTTQLGDVLSQCGEGEIEDHYRAFHVGVSLFLLLAEWKHAIRKAEPDAQRFLASAKLQVSDIDHSSSIVQIPNLQEFLNNIDSLQNVSELDELQKKLNQWELPLLLFSNTKSSLFSRNDYVNSEEDKLEKSQSTVAFLKFEIDGKPAEQYNYLKPGVSYDLSIEVRVSNWPMGANFLTLTPVTIDIREKSWLPSFKFEKPEGNGPFSFTETGRAVLEVAHSFGSRPYEFLYAAEFDDSSYCKSLEVIGHRRLLLEGTDVTSNPRTGFSHVDQHLLKIRNRMREFPGLNSDDIANTMIVLEGLGNIAAQALKAGSFEANMSEKQFQIKVSEMLRSRSEIGENLESHLEAAGGITDLTFKGIPIELKVEKTKILFAKDFTNYFDQTASYAIALGKKVGILSVLECTDKKSGPVGAIEDDIGFFIHQTGQSVIAIIVIVIRGGLPKPSSYSK